MSIQTLSQKSNSTSNQVTEGGGHVVEDDLKKKWKMNSKLLFFLTQLERRPQQKMEDNLKKRYKKMEDDLKKMNGRRP